MKKKLVIALSLLVVVAIAIGGTLAYFSMSTEEIENVFTVGKNVKVTLVDIYNQGTEVTPGADIAKEVGIENTAEEGGTAVYAAVTAEFKYFAPEYYPGTDLPKYANIITADDYTALSAAEQAEYVEITEDSSYVGYYIKADAVSLTYWDGDTQVTDPDAIEAGEYNKRKATYDSGDVVYAATATVADYGNSDEALWGIIKLQNGEEGAFVDGLADGWTYAGNTADGKAVFVYESAIEPGDYSAAFTNVHVDEDATADDLFPFSITVKGYAVQATGFDSAEAALAASFDSLVPPLTA
ncbi:MAG: SipW-dependent-type signal peptide-containing protein [Clostridia bacterium]|nr:SipW-dependent-type signal peptide-containing protein [Clostridia bacterium]